MPYVTTADGTEIFYKDWGPKDATPIVFHHGWPLSADDWDNQMMFFLGKGYRVIAHDRRGHGRSSQTDGGNEMDTYAADVAALIDHLDLKGAIHVGHSTGGGEAIHYVARAKPGRVAKAVLILHGDDDQIVPIADSALLSAKLVKNGTLKVYPGFPHGMATTHADVINADLLAWIEAGEGEAAAASAEDREPVPA